jgi:hypothetical protein
LNDVVGGNITIIVLTYSKCWEIVLLGMNCRREDHLAFERETKKFDSLTAIEYNCFSVQVLGRWCTWVLYFDKSHLSSRSSSKQTFAN